LTRIGLGFPQYSNDGVVIPAGLVVGEDPEEDASRFRRTENGVCLITQPMINRLRT
jgi:glucose-1-phosphate adenylyltransferase